jgi:hypothetical protein
MKRDKPLRQHAQCCACRAHSLALSNKSCCSSSRFLKSRLLNSRLGTIAIASGTYVYDLGRACRVRHDRHRSGGLDSPRTLIRSNAGGAAAPCTVQTEQVAPGCRTRKLRPSSSVRTRTNPARTRRRATSERRTAPSCHSPRVTKAKRIALCRPATSDAESMLVVMTMSKRSGARTSCPRDASSWSIPGLPWRTCGTRAGKRPEAPRLSPPPIRPGTATSSMHRLSDGDRERLRILRR